MSLPSLIALRSFDMSFGCSGDVFADPSRMVSLQMISVFIYSSLQKVGENCSTFLLV